MCTLSRQEGIGHCQFDTFWWWASVQLNNMSESHSLLSEASPLEPALHHRGLSISTTACYLLVAFISSTLMWPCNQLFRCLRGALALRETILTSSIYLRSHQVLGTTRDGGYFSSAKTIFKGRARALAMGLSSTTGSMWCMSTSIGPFNHVNKRHSLAIASRFSSR